MKTHKKKQGLSLIEILMAVVIIAILAAITIGVVSHIDDQNNQRQLESTYSLLEGALGEYYEYWKGFPDPNMAPYLTHSAALYGQLNTTPGTQEFLEGISEKLKQNNPDAVDMPQTQILDPWGTMLDYRYISGDTFPELVSAGPDKIFGTIDDIYNK